MGKRLKMKAKLIFDLDKAEDREDFEIYSKATDYYSALFEISINLRKKIEWELDNQDMSPYTVCERIFEKISEELEKNNIEF